MKKQDKRKKLAKWLKEGLLRLGPTFIKIGQQFSTRVDILAKEYVDELAELQVGCPFRSRWIAIFADAVWIIFWTKIKFFSPTDKKYTVICRIKCLRLIQRLQ